VLELGLELGLGFVLRYGSGLELGFVLAFRDECVG
jgi:hypothetical protein